MVHWLSHLESDLPAGDAWLSAAEMARLAGFKIAKRRLDWRLGRFTAKRALAAYLADRGERLGEFEIHPADDGAPEPFLDGEPLPLSLSLSHAGGLALCALASSKVALGCDVEKVETRSSVFVRDYFTTAEREFVESAPEARRARLATLIWSAKESALKALREGLRRDTRSVVVEIPEGRPEGGWWPLTVRDNVSEKYFEGWWRPSHDTVFTVVAAPPPGVPIQLRV